MAAQRTYRVQAANAPKLVFELSRIGTRLEAATQSTALFRAPTGLLEVRTTRDRRVLGSRTDSTDHVVDVGTGPLEELLENVGLRRETTYINEREQYRVGSAIISLEHVVPLGWFCVITAERDADVDAFAARLGLSAADVERRDYSRLVADGSTPVPPGSSPAPARAARAKAAAQTKPKAQPEAVRAPAAAAPAIVKAPRSDAVAKPEGRSGRSRTMRLLVIAIVCGLLAVLVDLLLAVLLGAVLLMLEWALGGRRKPPGTGEPPAAAV